MQIMVTQEHINRAIAARNAAYLRKPANKVISDFQISQNCPVAQALRDAGIDFIAVAYDTVETPYGEVGSLSKNARELTLLFSDQWETDARPITIEYTPYEPFETRKV